MLCFLAALLSGCGTFQTVTERGQNQLRYSTKYSKYTCKTIPRVFSGVIFDGCQFFGPANPYGSRDRAGAVLADMLFSLALDTAVLPYTAYMQYRFGNTPMSHDADDGGLLAGASLP